MSIFAGSPLTDRPVRLGFHFRGNQTCNLARRKAPRTLRLATAGELWGRIRGRLDRKQGKPRRL